MFERFTERARQVIVLAREEARALKHNYIGTEHFLLGLLREKEDVAAWALGSLNITVERVRAQVVGIVGSGEEVSPGRIPFTPRAKKVLEQALREAQSLGHNYIGPEHILLGLLRENEGVAMRILLDLDADAETIRNEVVRLLGKRGAPQPPPYSVEPAKQSELPDTRFEGAWELIKTMVREVDDQLDRRADAGDLLVALACVPEGVVASALSALGVDADALTRVLDDVRRAGARSKLLPPGEQAAEIDRLRREKEAKIHTKDFEAAAKLRDHERRLKNEALKLTQSHADDVLTDIRARLGLAEG